MQLPIRCASFHRVSQVLVAGALSMLFGMGLSFITEGAIPFAASDPLLFLAAVAAGSVVAMLGIVLLKKPLAAK